MAELIPGRSCGACRQCCTVPPIDDPAIQKMPGIACRHLCDAGCAIYAARPDPCKGYYCLWRFYGFLDDSWRPDRSGVLMSVEMNDIPPGFGPSGVTLLLTDPDPAIQTGTVQADGFVALVVRLIRAHIAVFLSVRPPGHCAARVFLNTPAMGRAVDAGLAADIRHHLGRALQTARTFPVQPLHLAHRGNDVGR